MYIIVNKTTGFNTKHVGSFPDLSTELNRGEDLIIISLYSNTIKIPYSYDEYGETMWDYKNFDIPNGILRGL